MANRIDFDEDLMLLIDTNEFAESADYTTIAGVTTTVLGVFDQPSLDVSLGVSLELADSDPRFTMRTLDLPSDAQQGDALVVDNKSWTVRKFERDGTGVVVLKLERA